METTKPWYLSKTVWVGAATILAGILTASGAGVFDPNALVEIGLGIATIITRALAKQSITLS